MTGRTAGVGDSYSSSVAFLTKSLRVEPRIEPMYWPEHWDKGLKVPRRPAESAGGGSKEANGLLDAVIEKEKKKAPGRKGKPVYAVFPTPAFESRFKSCLAKVPVDCRMERDGSKRVLALRPKNVQRFDELIRTSGLANCETAVKVVQWLRANPSEYLRFESH